MFFQHKNRMTPARIILIGFALLILTGAVLLTLPIATRDGQGAPFLDALFTATSATCVTGLVVQDTSLYWTVFGQAVIILLIQIGGMGVVTAAVTLSMLAGRKIGLKERWVMQESISAPQVGGIVRRTRFILAATFLMEGIGALLLAVRFVPEMGLRGIWYAVFHSISSFCNAGFDLMGVEEGAPFVSLTGYAGDPLVTLTVAGLIALGGIGFLTWGDVREHKWHMSAYCLQTKLVLTVTALLILLPTLFFLFYEFRLPQWDSLTTGEKVLGAVFQSVTPRTAGYNTVDLTLLSGPSQMIITLLMLIGALTNIVLDPIYNKMYPYDDWLELYIKGNGKDGFAGRATLEDAKLIIPCDRYIRIEKFSLGGGQYAEVVKAVAKYTYLNGVVNRQGKEVVPCKYAHIYMIENGQCLVMESGTNLRKWVKLNE